MKSRNKTALAARAVDVGNLSDDDLVTDAQLFAFLRVGQTHGLELQKEVDFPAPIWLGPRAKRHVWGGIKKWITTKVKAPRRAL